MLQQTPVVRVAPIWEEWVERWPLPSAMAASSQAEVLRAWGKLGYPRRALRLHECAGVLAAEHGDVVPEDVDTLLSLPGIGSYTARAVACFAYGQRVPVVDTNVRRVVARAVHGNAEPGNPSNTRDHRRRRGAAAEDACARRHLQRSSHGTRCTDLHGADPELRELPFAELRVGRFWQTGTHWTHPRRCRSSRAQIARFVEN